MNRAGARAEGVDHRAGNLIEDRPNGHCQNATAELEVQYKPHSATILSQLCECPSAFEAFERSLLQRQFDTRVRHQAVTRREFLVQWTFGNPDGRNHFFRETRENLRTSTPWQELRIGFDVIDQPKHLRG